MPSLDPTTIPPDRLASMLRAWAAGLHTWEAATELIILHGRWLTRDDFLRSLVDAVDDGWTRDGRTVPMASIDWQGVNRFLDRPGVEGSSSEVTVLRLAASLAGVTQPESLGDLTSGLDQANAALVLHALGHRFGWHERRVAVTVTGNFPGREPGQRRGPVPGPRGR